MGCSKQSAISQASDMTFLSYRPATCGFSPGKGSWAPASPAQMLLPVAPSPPHPCSLPPGDEIRDLEMVPDSMLHSSSERPTFIDRLANSLTKRKRSTPQKFVGKSPIGEETSTGRHHLSKS